MNPDALPQAVPARVALVTGCGKPDGMGQAIAAALAAAGMAVLVTDREPGGVSNAHQPESGTDELADLVTRLRAGDGVAESVLGDVADPGDAQRLVDEAVERFGRLDVLVNNAAAPQGADRVDVEDVPLEAWHHQLAVNLTGPFLLARAAVPVMRRQRYGRIVSISSMAGLTASPRSAAYSASKAGVIGLTRALACDVGPWGITVNAVCPGLIDTSRAGLYGAGRDPDERAAAVAARGRTIPAGRVGRPGDVAAAVAYLASEAAGFVTGQSMVLDGGGLLPFPLTHPE